MQKLKLSIPEPCHENWNNMTPEGQGRFCNSCAKQVIDFSAMTDNQLMQYFANLKNENVCGRVYPDQLDRTFVMPVPARKKIWLYWQYVLAILLFFFGKNQQANAQAKPPKTELHPKPANPNPETRIMLGGIRRVTNDELRTISIKDEAGKAVPFASIEIISSGVHLVADSLGQIKLSTLNDSENVRITAVGFQPQTIAIKEIKEDTIKLDFMLLGEVVVTAYPAKIGKIMAGGISFTKTHVVRSVVDTLTGFIPSSNNAIKVFPNPVKKGGRINLSLNLKKTGQYQLFILDAAGKQLLQQCVQVSSKQENQQITLPINWPGGPYFIQLIDDKNKLVGASKFLVN